MTQQKQEIIESLARRILNSTVADFQREGADFSDPSINRELRKTISKALRRAVQLNEA